MTDQAVERIRPMDQPEACWVEVGDALYRTLELRLRGGDFPHLLREDRLLIGLYGLGPYGKRTIMRRAVWALCVEGRKVVLLASSVDAAKIEAVSEMLRHLQRELETEKKRVSRLKTRIDALSKLLSPR